MAALVCDICGGKLVMQSSGVAKCDSCGMEYTRERIQEKVQEIKGTVKIDGPVETVKGDAEKERLFKIAHNCKENKQYEDAIKIYNNIIEDYPNDWRGYWGKICSTPIYFKSIVYNNGNELYDSYRELFLKPEYDKALAYAPNSEKESIIAHREKRYDKINYYTQLSVDNAKKLISLSRKHNYMRSFEEVTGLSLTLGDTIEKYLDNFCYVLDDHNYMLKEISICSSNLENFEGLAINRHNLYIAEGKCPLCSDHKPLGLFGKCKYHGKIKKIEI